MAEPCLRNAAVFCQVEEAPSVNLWFTTITNLGHMPLSCPSDLGEILPELEEVISALFLVLGTMMALVPEDPKPWLWRGGKKTNEGHTGRM